jgi:hypothetical protein
MLKAIRMLQVSTVPIYSLGLLMIYLLRTYVEYYATINGEIAMATPMVTTIRKMLGIATLSLSMKPSMQIPMRTDMATTSVATMPMIVQVYGAIPQSIRKVAQIQMAMVIPTFTLMTSMQRVASERMSLEMHSPMTPINGAIAMAMDSERIQLEIGIAVRTFRVHYSVFQALVVRCL